MKVPWFGDRCIICLGNDGLSEEHVIPAALGGDLKCEFLCKPCNDLFGSSFEAKARTDPAIRIAVAKLRSEIPLIHDRVEDGQQYFAQSGPARVAGIYRQGAVMPLTSRHTDGSLMAPADDASAHIERILVKEGQPPAFVQAALMSLAAAPEGQRVQLSPNLSIINWPTDEAKADLSRGTPLSDLVAVKIAFEFFALISGTAICDDISQLNEIRDALKFGGASDAFSVDRLLAQDYAPFHGICFEGNDPHVKIQVRLFGMLAYRVHFHRLSLDQRKIVYTHDLKSRDYVREC
jgi:HNH endonuclease